MAYWIKNKYPCSNPDCPYGQKAFTEGDKCHKCRLRAEPAMMSKEDTEAARRVREEPNKVKRRYDGFI